MSPQSVAKSISTRKGMKRNEEDQTQKETKVCILSHIVSSYRYQPQCSAKEEWKDVGIKARSEFIMFAISD